MVDLRGGFIGIFINTKHIAMRKFSFLLTLCLLCLFSFSQNEGPYFLSQPCLTPDGQIVVFSFEGDLWKANVKDGQASRITAMQGYETSPRVSPDGKWVAFTGRQYGNGDVYILPINGGEIRQLTYHSSNDEVTSWSWDSKSIYFTSARMGQNSGFKVSIDGGTPKRVFGDYFFLYDHLLFEHPTSGEIFFNDTWESGTQAQRKHYKGPFNPDIQSYNPVTKKYKRYTDWQGKDFYATLDHSGNIYFISDEVNNEYNLYSFENGKKKALTNFKTSIKTPIVNANGGRIVFEKDYQLWMYDVASKKAERLNISIVRNSVLSKDKDLDIKGNITNFDISADGKKIAFTSRGEIFVSDIEGKFIEEINKNSVERAREIKWMPDNRTLLFNQTKNGYLNWYTISADGTGGLKELTSDAKNDRAMTLNKKKTLGVYLCGRDEVRLLDLKTLESRTIVKDEIWGFQGSDPGFSPDDDYVMFTAFRNFEEDIFVYNIKDKKTTNLTNTGITESGPVWSPDNRYIFFTSQRLKPSYPFGLQDAKVYRLPLEKLDDPYRSDKFNDLFKEEKKDTSKKPVPTPPPAAVKIDLDNIMERIEQVSPSFGSQSIVGVYQKGDKTTVLYTSNHSEGKSALWKTVIEPFEQNKTEKIAGTDNLNGSDFVNVNDKLYLLYNGTIWKLNLDQNKTDAISMSYTFRRNLKGEFSQMFDEAWAQIEENYYDGNFHGADWAGLHKAYGAYVPYLNNRNDLRIMLNDMLGELNSSHQGFGTFGADETIPLLNRTMETGIIFENDDPYKVKYIVNRSAADRSTVDVRAGDVLVKVNDENVDQKMDRNYYFTRPSIDQEMRLTFSRGGQNYDVKLHPGTTLFNNMYDEWIDNNRKRVNDLSKNRIAYSCMKNMGQGELESFIVDMTKQLNNRDALILDLRYNTGGNVHDEVLRFLQQRSYLQWKYRDGQLTRQGNFTPADKPIVLLTNEQSLSDAEMTAQGFKSLKLGKIIGNETYHWIIFTSGVSLVDGSSVRMPSWGCYTLDGKDIESTGVQPDILVVNTFEDKINGRDPQIERAVAEILKELK
jgi:Tol biopolymer transport system component